MRYTTELLVNAQPQEVFDALHQYKRERNPNAFFSWLFLGTIVKMDFRVLTENVVGLGATYDWKFRLFGYPIFAFQEQIVEWEEGKTVSYQAISGWNMLFRVHVEPHHGQTLATIQIDFSLGMKVLNRLFRFFIEWGLHKVSKRSIDRGLRKRCHQQTVPRELQ
jgi:polyketide cyclase/dehydrase/lipid transport protein